MSRSPLALLLRTIACLFLLSLGINRCQSADILEGLRQSHPRLIVDASTWEQLRANRQKDPQLAHLLDIIEKDARHLLEIPPVEYHKTGRRLLSVSRSAQQRITGLAMTFHLTGDPAFIQRAEQEMLAAAAFQDWNPSHFLDLGEMTAALAIGYDWLYEDLSPETRAKIREAIVSKGLSVALDPAAPNNGWQTADMNWNQVCFGGLVLGALAVAEDEPGISRQLLNRARSQVFHGFKPYQPDGVYPEGPGYWSYGTSFSVLMIAALESSLGTDWSLTESPGFLASAGGYLQCRAPSGLLFDFGDGTEQSSIEPILFWFTQKTGDGGLISKQLARIQKVNSINTELKKQEAARFLPFAAIWWPQYTSEAVPRLPLRWFGRGDTPMVIFRSSWTDENALYLALKGGMASHSHAHLDAGSFVFEMDGIRWARDLGKQEYDSLESKGVDLWNSRQDSQRWQVFRLNNRSHNTLTIDDQLQRVDGAAKIIGFSDVAANPWAIADLTPVFAGQASQVRRGFRVLKDRGVLVQDELVGLKPGADVRWAMVTGADVSIQNDGLHATLSESGKHLEVSLLAPTTAKLAVIEADPPVDHFNAPNPERRILVVHAPAPSDGKLTIAVQLTGTDPTPSSPLVSLEKWAEKSP